MPAFNAEKFIAKSIESVLAQTYENWELLVVDDGSTDDTKDIVNSFAVNDTRIRYFHQLNKKQAAARNLGIQNANGALIAFLDADDLWHPKKLERQVEIMGKVEADVYYCGGCLVDEYDQFLKDYPIEYGRFSGKEMYKILYRYNPVPVLSVLLKKRIVEDVGLMDESAHIVGCEDLDYWIRTAAAGATFYGIDEKLFSYRINPTGTSRNTIHMLYAEKITLTKNLKKDWFSIKEIRQLFKPSVIPLLVYLINASKIKETSALLQNVWQNVPLISYKIIYILFKIFRKSSVALIKAVNKTDSFLHGEKYVSSIHSLL